MNEEKTTYYFEDDIDDLAYYWKMRRTDMSWSKRLEVALWLVLRNQLPLEMPDRDTVAYGSLDNLLLEGEDGIVAWEYNAEEMLKAKNAWNEIKLRIMADKDREEVNGQNSTV